MYCGQCGKQIDDDSRFCRFCGATQPPIADDIAAIVLAIIAIASLGKPDASPSSNAEAVAGMLADNMEMQADNMDALADATAEPVVPDAIPEKTDVWSYTTDVDKVRGGTSYFASTTSTNTVHQDPPYDSATTMQLTVRRMPSSGTDVVLTISSGQMMCPSYEGCSGTVRFDNGAARRITFNGPADSSSDTIFVIGAKSFIGSLKKAKKVVIEKTLYEAGNPQFEFDVSGLKWEH